MKLWYSRTSFNLAANTSGLNKSPTRKPRRATLSSYAGPIPRPVVPIGLSPRAVSRATSNATWKGKISGHASLIKRRSRTGTPRSSSMPISLISASGDKTTPLPITHLTLSRNTPDGIRCRTVFSPSITKV